MAKVQKTRKPQTLGELRKIEHPVYSVKTELRRNLIAKIRRGEDFFPGIIGYEETVIPQLENAILSGQDVIFLGERGQAKTRMIRSLVTLLDEEIPVIAGCEVNDNPYDPICKSCRDKVAELGDRVEIAWLGREERYAEKLATPDVTIADLIGEVDPIKVAEGRYLSDELTIHYGLIPRTNRGIFAINELPDLGEKIQVGLFNIMEERDVQVRGYKIRLPLDVYIVASANPEDYTSRGRIITPLKDRYGSEIRTHYPKFLKHEIEIMEQERNRFDDDGAFTTTIPDYFKELIAEITALARKSPEVNQRSGVSVRVSIANYESIISNAMRRAIRLDETEVVPRVSDLPSLIASTSGKIEFETVEEDRNQGLIEKLIDKAVLNTFNRYFQVQQFDAFLTRFKAGWSVEVSDRMKSSEYRERTEQASPHGAEMRGLLEALKKLKCDETPALLASGLEFILEGLHLHHRLNKEKLPGKSAYRA
ncbi:MAG TPA: magnesium chelatase [Thermodesulfobacteriota bacterium]|nr:magnesium chelatase [Thermodesulfobacteriota bacterium]